MNDASNPFLNAQDLINLGRARRTRRDCPTCAQLVCPGWESMPGSFDRGALRLAGTLRIEGDEEPTFEEYHPAGTHGWSVDAPIAPAFFPYNRCDAWQCKACGRPFLRYTEVGGYYVDERVRELDPTLVVDPATTGTSG